MSDPVLSPADFPQEMDISVIGTVTIGEKGQIVLPKEARDLLELHKGDKMIVLLRKKKVLGLIRAADYAELVECLRLEMTTGS